METKKFYWLKLQADFFKRHDIRIIEAMPNGKDYVLFYLKLLCESITHEGKLRFSDVIPYNEEMLATITNTNVDVVKTAIQIFTQLNLMEIMDDGTYYFNEVNKLIGSAIDSPNANRVRRFRKKQALQNDEYNDEYNEKEHYDPEQVKGLVLQNKNRGVTCEWCGTKTNAIHYHHYPIPRKNGGTELVKICPNCHYEYHNIINRRFTK